MVNKANPTTNVTATEKKLIMDSLVAETRAYPRMSFVRSHLSRLKSCRKDQIIQLCQVEVAFGR